MAQQPTIQTGEQIESDRKVEFDRRVASMRDWWRQQADREVAMTVPKAIEYGSADTIEIGYDLLTTFSGKSRVQVYEEFGGPAAADRYAFEVGCYFFIRGKLARFTSALRRGESVSDDTLHDIAVYTKMIQRVREVGAWPFPESFGQVDTLPGGVQNTLPGEGVRHDG